MGLAYWLALSKKKPRPRWAVILKAPSGQERIAWRSVGKREAVTVARRINANGGTPVAEVKRVYTL